MLEKKIPWIAKPSTTETSKALSAAIVILQNDPATVNMGSWVAMGAIGDEAAFTNAKEDNTQNTAEEIFILDGGSDDL